MLFYYLILLYFNALFLMVVNSFYSVSFVNVYLPLEEVYFILHYYQVTNTNVSRSRPEERNCQLT